MEDTNFEKYKPYLKPITVIAVGIIFLAFSVFLLFSNPSSGIEILDSNSNPSSFSVPATEITIEVAGSVSKPGVYKLPSGSRIQDALLSAGNITVSADAIFVEKNINKAAKLIDGQKIYIPKKGESASPVLGANTNKSININSASQNELESLPGIGPATATKIINARPYGDLQELTSKKAVSASVFEKIKNLISLF